MKNILISYLTSLTVMAVFDAIWLGTMVSRFYNPKLGTLIADTPKWMPAVLFYLLYAAGITFFVILPSLESNKSILTTLFIGAAFGFIAYATYDLTNHATLRNWPLAVTVVDLAWGTAVTGVVGALSVLIARKIFSL